MKRRWAVDPHSRRLTTPLRVALGRLSLLLGLGAIVAPSQATCED